MPLLNYRTKIWPKSTAGWTENNKDKKFEGIDNADKKSVLIIFWPGQKGIYHQVEFRQRLQGLLTDILDLPLNIKM